MTSYNSYDLYVIERYRVLRIFYGSRTRALGLMTSGERSILQSHGI